MKNQLKGICLLLFALLLFGIHTEGLWIPYLGSTIEALSGFASLLCGIGGVYLAFRGDK